jgi:GNAT superfamily N-acetyltransferase
LHYSSAISFRRESTVAVEASLSSVDVVGSTYVEVEVAELDRFQWRIVRSMRLAALCDSPDAFVNTWAAELRLPPKYWQDSIADSTWVVARDGEEAVGIARLAPAERHALQAPFVESVWVKRPYRRRHVLSQMLERLEDHARAADATELRLWVLDSNDSARDAYVKLGFNLVVGVAQDIKPRGDGTFVKERLMIKTLL